MGSRERPPRTAAAPATTMDVESSDWTRELRASGSVGRAATQRLYELLTRICRSELHRRSAQLDISGPEFDDLASQAAGDAVIAIVKKLDQFRGESRFTTWAYKFAIFEVSAKIGHNWWRDRGAYIDDEDWNRLPERIGATPDEFSESRELADAVRSAVQTELTEHQRNIFVSVVLNGVPLDAVVDQLGMERNTVYKVIFDARRKIRAYLVANQYLTDAERGR